MNGSCVIDPLPSISNKLNKSFISAMSFFVVPMESVRKILRNFQRKNRFKVMETHLRFLNTRYLLANQNPPFRQENFPFSVIFKFSRFFYLRMIFRAEAKSINKLSTPVNYQRISTQCWRYLFLLLDSFFECSKLMSPPDSKWEDKSYNKVTKKWQLRRSMNNVL